MVELWELKDVTIDSLDELDEDDSLFIGFDENDQGLLYYIVKSDWSIGTFGDKLYVFDDDDIKLRAKIEHIEFMFAY